MGARLFLPREAPDPAPPRTQPAALRPRSEATALLLVAFAVTGTLALLSLRVDPDDPSVVGPNWVGPAGAQVAEAMARAFGIVAWCFPLEAALFAVPLLRRKPPTWSSLRLFGDLLLLIVSAALVQVASPAFVAFGRLRGGGDVGFLFGELFSSLFSTIGSFLIGVTVIALVLIGRCDLSFIELCRRVASYASRAFAWCRAACLRLSAAWAEARQLQRSQREASRRAAEPKIDMHPSDEAILHQLAESDDWIPLERTGKPPMAIAESLRAGYPSREALREQTPVPASAAAPESATPELPKELSEITNPEPPPVADEPEASVEANMDVEGQVSAPVSAVSSSVGNDPLRIVDTRQFAEVERAPARPRRSKSRFKLPETALLDPPEAHVKSIDRNEVLAMADRLERTLLDYGVAGKVEEVHPGPTVTTYEFSPQAGTKVSKVSSLSDDLALGLSRKVRIIAPIPGKARIGFELPNDERIPVNLRELIEDHRFEKLAARAPLPVVLGRDIVGAPFYADLASMPHVIVAGATGAGKSVGLNVMLSSLLFQRSPDELRMLMIDPKVVELAPFDGIPHMLLPVVTDMKLAAKALKWGVDEMEKRYQAFALAGTKNITTYNQWVGKVQAGELPPPPVEEVQALTADGAVVSVPCSKTGTDGAPLPGKLPHIVIVVDEFADLIMQQGKEVETAVARLAQKARAAGMHVVLATQRPSVDVITGMIKANFPTRIAFRVAQKVDSRTILDEMGAEVLLGRGDMLVKLNGSTETHRVQCPFVSEEEVNALTDYLRSQGNPEYCDAILRGGDDDENAPAEEDVDPRYDEAVRIVAETQRCSTSWLQRKLTVGYNRAAKIVETMERRGVVGPANGAKDREVFVHPQ
jgi:DNA segregation ATPase FtsK/SpoIIIE, S-DNA-T family